jgi:hypothetical protein
LDRKASSREGGPRRYLRDRRTPRRLSRASAPTLATSGLPAPGGATAPRDHLASESDRTLARQTEKKMTGHVRKRCAYGPKAWTRCPQSRDPRNVRPSEQRDSYLPVRSRCLHPGQQQGRRWPSSSSS